jgi:hypothetical protein
MKDLHSVIALCRALARSISRERAVWTRNFAGGTVASTGEAILVASEDSYIPADWAFLVRLFWCCRRGGLQPDGKLQFGSVENQNC